MDVRILVVDNHDSFVFNLVQYLRELGAECEVRTRDDVTLAEAGHFDGVLLSPGPGRPEDTGICLDLVRSGQPVLGVCLGLQAIAIVHGASVRRAPELIHGYTSPVHHGGEGVLAGLPSPFNATRYHSLAIAPETVPPGLVVTACTPDGTIMAMRSLTAPVEGVQFHPESVLSEGGHQILANWLRTCAQSPLAGVASTPGKGNENFL